MSKQSVTGSMCLAIEMVRAALLLIPEKGKKLGDSFLHIDMEHDYDRQGIRVVSLSILMRGDVYVSAQAYMYRSRMGWVPAQLEIQLPPGNLFRQGEPTWYFSCIEEETRIAARLNSTVRQPSPSASG